ncbi:hypothetical protein CRG98_029397, partial [Punica granatum]
MLKVGTGLDSTQWAWMIDFLIGYPEVFAWSYADMPSLDPSIVKHFLPLDTEKFPPKRQKLRRQRAGLFLRIKDEVVKQINAGFLEVCNYSEWVANIVPVEKKDGRVRVCVDYRDLNKASPKDNFPLPHIDVLVDNTAHHTQFSFMDGFSGYNQICMAEEDKSKTTFTTMEYKLRLNPAKCTFGAKSGKLLGFVVSERGIEVDLEKVKAIRELPPPSSVCEVRGFLGRLNYIARFIANLTDKCQPLFRLLCKNAAVEWDEECQKAFDTIKAYLIQPSVLVPPTPDCPLILYLTVRRQSLGCMLGQEDESTHTERAIYYLSKKFMERESNYLENREDMLHAGMGHVETPAVYALPYNPLAVKSGSPEKTKDAKLVPYQEYLEGLVENFENISFTDTPRMKNQFADALAMLASMVSIAEENLIEPLEIEITKGPAHCDAIEATDAKLWYKDIKNFLQTGQYPPFTYRRDWKMLKRLAIHYFLSGETLYRRSFDATLLRCIDEHEARRLMEEVHGGSCEPHMNGLMLAKKLMCLGYY